MSYDEAEEQRRRELAAKQPAEIGGLFDVPEDEPGHVIITSDPALEGKRC